MGTYAVEGDALRAVGGPKPTALWELRGKDVPIGFHGRPQAEFEGL